MRPVVAVTSDSEPVPREGLFLRRAYLRAVESSGAVPFVVAPGRGEDAHEILARVLGLFLTGGGDIDPALFGEDPHPSVKRVDRERDVFEIALVKAALERDLPVLAVCRGQQLLNVACGGSIVQDIPSQIAGAVDHRPGGDRARVAHEVELLPDSRVRSILGSARAAVNSTHHQAVRAPGRDLVVSARCPDDGVVEGIESSRHRFVVGVQWHPEEFWNRAPSFKPLFDAWVRTCGGA